MFSKKDISLLQQVMKCSCLCVLLCIIDFVEIKELVASHLHCLRLLCYEYNVNGCGYIHGKDYMHQIKLIQLKFRNFF